MPLADRALFQVDQAEPEDQGLLRHLQERGPHPGLDCHDRVSPALLGETAQYRGVGLTGTHPPGADQADGALLSLGNALSQEKSTTSAIAPVQCGGWHLIPLCKFLAGHY